MIGEQATFDRLVTQHQHTVLRVCRSILRDEHLGADAAQETFLRLWRRILDDRVPERSGGWLRRVAVTTSLDHARGRRARGRSADEAPVATERSTPEGEVRARELQRRLDDALHQLSEGQRTIFLLRHEGGMSLREIAETLDLAVPTVKTQFARACLRLQHALRAFRPDPPAGSPADPPSSETER